MAARAYEKAFYRRYHRDHPRFIARTLKVREVLRLWRVAVVGLALHPNLTSSGSIPLVCSSPQVRGPAHQNDLIRHGGSAPVSDMAAVRPAEMLPVPWWWKRQKQEKSGPKAWRRHGKKKGLS